MVAWYEGTIRAEDVCRETWGRRFFVCQQISKKTQVIKSCDENIKIDICHGAKKAYMRHSLIKTKSVDF